MNSPDIAAISPPIAVIETSAVWLPKEVAVKVFLVGDLLTAGADRTDAVGVVAALGRALFMLSM